MIEDFLANPYVSGFGYFVGMISSVIAIVQFFTISRKNKEISDLNIKINDINNQVSSSHDSNKNTVNQGNSSQYFQSNNGSVSIDNRG
ncbi:MULTISPECIES: hypothetical protein [Proteus]|uniref:hypothetical protein n=1 Tax=Proteus TaxID=583 RepID=UPI000531C7A1|nr:MULTISPECIES: hypothetical protein [Proteus]EIT1739308.1 hypothetical protein [Proteus mirabilis]EJG2210944.1 hypothetical protein [Proteus mirabilis]EKX4939283.1 hypothetical protein [Proteus mirabilis]EKX6258128.1 hypothetical protein [Proteus mirabilis]EKX6489628.1 hypothetical protein [Proteus mirabilis]